MRILEIGNKFKSTEKLPYLTDHTFLDFDLVVINYDDLLKDQHVTYGPRYLKRRIALDEFLKHKEMPLIVFAPVRSNINFQLPSTPTTTIANLLPTGDFNFNLETGEGVNVIDKTPFSDFFRKHIKHFRYQSYFTKYFGTALVETQHAKKVLSFYNDRVIMLPQLVNHLGESETAFFEDLMTSIRALQNNKKAILPDWTRLYRLPGESSLIDELKKLDDESNRIKEAITRKQSELGGLQQIKALLTETGDILESKIQNIFEEIGLEIIESERNRDDLIIKYGDRVAVVEIKGVTGSAAERNSAQLEKWISTYYEKTDIMPKGILIVNSYRTLPLENRSEVTFPHQMLNYAVRREHCLIDTKQLIGLYLEIKNDITRKDHLLNELFETVGIYKKYSDWTVFIEKVDET